MSSRFVFPYCHLEVALSSSALTKRKNATRYCHCTAFSTTCAMLPPSPLNHLTVHPETSSGNAPRRRVWPRRQHRSEADRSQAKVFFFCFFHTILNPIMLKAATQCRVKGVPPFTPIFMQNEWELRAKKGPQSSKLFSVRTSTSMWGPCPAPGHLQWAKHELMTSFARL